MATHLTKHETDQVKRKIYDMYETLSRKYYPTQAIGTNTYFIFDMLASELIHIDTGVDGLDQDLSFWDARAKPISDRTTSRLYDVFGSYVNQNRGLYQGFNTFLSQDNLNIQGYRLTVAFLWDAYLHGSTRQAAIRSSQAFTTLSPRILEHYEEPRFKLSREDGLVTALDSSYVYDDTKMWHPEDVWKNALLFGFETGSASGSALAFIDTSGRAPSGSAYAGSYVAAYDKNFEALVDIDDEFYLTHCKVSESGNSWPKIYSESSYRLGVTLNTWIPTYTYGTYDNLFEIGDGTNKWTFDWLIRGIQTAYYNALPAHVDVYITYHWRYSVLASPDELQAGTYDNNDLGYKLGYLYNRGALENATYVSDTIDLGVSWEAAPQWYYDWTIWTRPNVEGTSYTVEARHAVTEGDLTSADWIEVSGPNQFVTLENRKRYAQYRVTITSTAQDNIRIFSFALKGESPISDIPEHVYYMVNAAVV